jgi:hypothetical protein
MAAARQPRRGQFTSSPEIVIRPQASRHQDGQTVPLDASMPPGPRHPGIKTDRQSLLMPRCLPAPGIQASRQTDKVKGAAGRGGAAARRGGRAWRGGERGAKVSRARPRKWGGQGGGSYLGVALICFGENKSHFWHR